MFPRLLSMFIIPRKKEVVQIDHSVAAISGNCIVACMPKVITISNLVITTNPLRQHKVSV